MDSDDDSEETSAVAAYRGVPATIILINVFDQKTAEISHAATCRLIRQYLRQSRSQHVAVCLFGTEVDDDSFMLGDKNVIDVFPLTMPTLEDYKKLQHMTMATVKQDTGMKMSSALLHCSKLFANCKKQISVRTVIMLLRLDTPPIEADQMPALKRAEDLAQSLVDIKLINVSDTNQKADDFYEKFLINSNIGKDSVILPKPIFDVLEIEKLMYQQSHRHLAVSQLSFDIGNGMFIGVGVYNLLRDSRHQKPAYLDSETNDIVTPVTETMKATIPTAGNLPMDIDEEQPKSIQVPLLKSELIYYQEYGGERVQFKDAEMKQLKNPFGRMLKLLGFKPSSLLSKEKWFLKKGYFLFPNEGIIEGSTVAFKALHQACIETGMVAICILCTRVNSRPINVALSPCTHPLGLNIDTGFDVINIPFAENVRALPETDEDDNSISDAHKTVMRNTINAIKFDYKPDIFEDPKIQSQYKNIEAIALHDEDVETFVDTTKPSSDKFNNIDDDLFQEIFGPFGSVPVKRPPAPQQNGNTKKIKIEIDECLLQNRLRNQKVDQYTVAELRDILKSTGISQLPALTGLKKAQLVDLMYQYF